MLGCCLFVARLLSICMLGCCLFVARLLSVCMLGCCLLWHWKHILNVVYVSALRTSSGKEFHSRSAAIPNARDAHASTTSKRSKYLSGHPNNLAGMWSTSRERRCGLVVTGLMNRCTLAVPVRRLHGDEPVASEDLRVLMKYTISFPGKNHNASESVLYRL